MSVWEFAHYRPRPGWRARWDRAVLAAAELAGRASGVALRATRLVPGVVAAGGFVAAGFTLSSWVGWAVVGVVGLALDRRMA